MANTILNEIYSQIAKKISEEEMKQKKQIVGHYLAQLYSIKNNLEDYHAITLVQNQKKMTGSKLAPILNQSGYYRFEKSAFDSGNKIQNETIIKNLIDAYEIIGQITAELELSKTAAPQLNLYYQDSKGNMHRFANLTSRISNLQDYIVPEIRSRGVRLKFNTTALVQLLEQQEYQQDELNTDISTHYDKFLKIFEKAKVNYGVVNEAFERHWDLAGHIKPSENFSDEISATEGWYLYGLSKGNDPFYTGGDTETAQIKSLNASIISNVNTIIYAINALLNLLSSISTDSEQAAEIIAQYERAFQQQEADPLDRLSDEIKKDLDQNIINELKEKLKIK